MNINDNNDNNTSNDTNDNATAEVIYHYTPECNYNAGINQLTFEAVVFLLTERCLQVYGTNLSIAPEVVIDKVGDEAIRLGRIPTPDHLYCGDDDVWAEERWSYVCAHMALIEDLKAGEKDLTTTQAGILYKLFPQLQKGIMIEAARKEITYAVTHRLYNADLQVDTNATAARRILEDLTLIDDQRPMDRLPETGNDYDRLTVGEDISYNKSRKSYQNLQCAMDNLFRWNIDRKLYRNVDF